MDLNWWCPDDIRAVADRIDADTDGEVPHVGG